MIVYAGEEFLTGDEIAEALLAYSRALGNEERAETVEIPVRGSDGSVVSATFLIGPASQIVARELTVEGEELEDPELVRRLQQLTRGLNTPTGAPLEGFPDDMHGLG